MNIKYKQDRLGALGEAYVSEFLTTSGHQIRMSDNKYDSQKDMSILIENEWKTIEVKTQVPFIVENAFTYKPNQVKKCSSVDHLFVVTLPPPSNMSYRYCGYIFHVDPKTMHTRSRMTKDGRTMVLIPIEQPAVEIVAQLSNLQVKNLQKYTVSRY